MPGYAYFIVAAGWLFWFLPFPLTGWTRSAPQTRDARARWGVLLQVIAYVLLGLGRFWELRPAAWRVGLSVIFLGLAILLSWTSTRALGKHLRFDAALSAGHELVQSGAYGFLRHPIYSSMLCPAIRFVPAILIFLVGTEIRMRIEDKLLADGFGDQFCQYRNKVSAYVPFVR